MIEFTREETVVPSERLRDWLAAGLAEALVALEVPEPPRVARTRVGPVDESSAHCSFRASPSALAPSRTPRAQRVFEEPRPRCLDRPGARAVAVTARIDAARAHDVPAEPDDDCGREVAEAVSASRFLPARRDGRPVEALYDELFPAAWGAPSTPGRRKTSTCCWGR
jgi:hypothetical protein